jgi:hypothetical protein
MDEDVDNEEKFGGWAHVCACVKSLEGNPGQIVQILHNSSEQRTLRDRGLMEGENVNCCC